MRIQSDMHKITMPFGWLSPDGDLWECKFYEHTATAEEICTKLNIKYADFLFKAEDDALLSLGWCKLGLQSWGERKYWVHWERPLTAYQRYFLKDYFDQEDKLQFPLDSSCVCKWLYEDEYFKNDI